MSGDEITITYSVRSSARAKRLRITVHDDGTVVVTKPRLVALGLIDTFVQKHAPWIKEKIAHFAKKPAKILGKYSRRDFYAHKERARALVTERIAYFNQYYAFSYGAVRIGNQRSRWGSCSSKKNLNFNYKIVFLPQPLQDYVIVHELCHLQELNHGKQFWDLVAQQIPDHMSRRKELRKY